MRATWNQWLTATRRGICVASALVFGCTVGCSFMPEKLGLRVRLDELPVTALSLSLVNEHNGSRVSALGPGQSAALVITATTRDGKQLATVGAGRGKVGFDNYKIEATVAAVSKRGIVSLPSDPRSSYGQPIHLHITPKTHAEIGADLDIAVRYDIPFVANFSGWNGVNGSDGSSGLDGLSGADALPGAVDPVTGVSGALGRGGDGSDGANGGDGFDGQDGAPGGDVNVWVRLEVDKTPLLQIKLVSGAHRSFFLVDPNGGSLKIVSDGGSGGCGGAGGRGGRGGRGGNGFPPGLNGRDGFPGHDGRSGRDGDGGKIVMSVDPSAQQFLSCISWSNKSGTGRPGPAPKINVEPVAPLW